MDDLCGSVEFVLALTAAALPHYQPPRPPQFEDEHESGSLEGQMRLKMGAE